MHIVPIEQLRNNNNYQRKARELLFCNDDNHNPNSNPNPKPILNLSLNHNPNLNPNHNPQTLTLT